MNQEIIKLRADVEKWRKDCSKLDNSPWSSKEWETLNILYQRAKRLLVAPEK